MKSQNFVLLLKLRSEGYLGTKTFALELVHSRSPGRICLFYPMCADGHSLQAWQVCHALVHLPDAQSRPAPPRTASPREYEVKCVFTSACVRSVHGLARMRRPLPGSTTTMHIRGGKSEVASVFERGFALRTQ